MPGIQFKSECRTKERFPISMELRFSYRRGKFVHLGTGRTKDLNDGAVRFESDQDLPSGTDLELRIAWPVKLQSVCPLELVIRGPLVRTDRAGSVLEMKTIEFQTCGERSFDQTAAMGNICSVLG